MIQTRLYLPADANELAQIFYNTIHHINAKDYSPEQIDAWAPLVTANPNHWREKWNNIVPIVATINHHLVGFVEFEPNGHIDCFYVHHEYQGKGIGRALMNAVFRQAKDQNLSRIFAEVSITAKPFFVNQGFEIIKEQQVNIREQRLTNFLMEHHI
jgi:putative acetyltransferase